MFFFILYKYKKFKKKFIEMNPNFIGLYENITVPFSKKPIRKHKDLNIHNEKFKIVIYLNEVENGGTIFFIGDEKKLIENKKNRLICFDIDLYHESQDFSINKGKVSKLTIGFRPITK